MYNLRVLSLSGRRLSTLSTCRPSSGLRWKSESTTSAEDVDASDYARDGEPAAVLPEEVMRQEEMDVVKAFREHAEGQATVIEQGSSYIPPRVQEVLHSASEKRSAAFAAVLPRCHEHDSTPIPDTLPERATPEGTAPTVRHEDATPEGTSATGRASVLGQFSDLPIGYTGNPAEGRQGAAASAVGAAGNAARAKSGAVSEDQAQQAAKAEAGTLDSRHSSEAESNRSPDDGDNDHKQTPPNMQGPSSNVADRQKAESLPPVGRDGSGFDPALPRTAGRGSNPEERAREEAEMVDALHSSEADSMRTPGMVQPQGHENESDLPPAPRLRHEAETGQVLPEAGAGAVALGSTWQDGGEEFDIRPQGKGVSKSRDSDAPTQGGLM